ncbi:hypothetical protein V494_01094 [Pseudogymnoascus sp. VKM F-4513 (FW-928)]|nr:hypothetical protein V494_01094 [Pseudogymnoascus sp. VKM F-4513 (FW-928)]
MAVAITSPRRHRSKHRKVSMAVVTTSPRRHRSKHRKDPTKYDCDLSGGQEEVMYVTFRMGPRSALVFKIGPQTPMNRAIRRCVSNWKDDEGGRFTARELFVFLPCNSRIEYDKRMTAAQLGIENHDLIDVYTQSYGG